MITRELPPEEWFRLKGTELEGLERYQASVLRVWVVENAAGEIRGAWSIQLKAHAEGFWIHPDDRKSAAVGRLLLGRMWQETGELGLDGVLTFAPNERIAGMLQKVGATPFPMPTYYWPRKSEAQVIGAEFHRTFEESTGHPPDHPQIDEHDRAVGEAITRAFSGDIVGAETAYNAWADRSGFARVRFIEQRDDQIVAASGSYTFTIKPSGHCEVLTCQE